MNMREETNVLHKKDEEVEVSDIEVIHEPAQESEQHQRQLGSPEFDERGMDNREGPMVLIDEDEAASYQSRWLQIQTGFVDSPKPAVEQAHNLVTEVKEHLSTLFDEEINRLEDQWNHGDEASTEDLRIMIKRYRSFIEHLLSV